MFLEILIGAIALIGYYYFKYQSWSTYWSKMGVKQPAHNPFPLGNNPITCFENMTNKANQGDITYDQYQQFKSERFYGTYMLPKCYPTIMLRDPELIRDVLVKDFNHFVDRNNVIDFFGQDGPTKMDLAWQKQMTNSTGDEWKHMRAMFSPIFTSGKLKMMVEFINIVSREVEKTLRLKAESGGDVELKEIFGNFSMDTISSCAFGIEAGSFQSQAKESDFVKNARSVFMVNLRDGLRFLSGQIPILKTIMNQLKVPFFKPKEAEFFYEIVAETLKHRMESKTRRNDLIDLMVEAMTSDLSQEVKANQHATEQFERDSALSHSGKTNRDMDELTIVATAMLMLVAGYDTTAQTLSFVGFELTRNQDIQKRLQDEIDEAFESHGNPDSLDYNTVQSLPYLDMVIHEALRLHSPVGILSRACVKDYTLRGTNITIKAGHELHIPTQGIHRDPEFYPDPLTFNPENFSKENRASRSPYTFLAFGQGPRACIGMRFALLEAKIGLIRAMRSFSFVGCDRTPKALSRDPESLLGNPLEPIVVKVVPRE